jgi:hypothetical protein
VTHTRAKGHRGPSGSAQSMAGSGLGGPGRPVRHIVCLVVVTMLLDNVVPCSSASCRWSRLDSVRNQSTSVSRGTPQGKKSGTMTHHRYGMMMRFRNCVSAMTLIGGEGPEAVGGGSWEFLQLHEREMDVRGEPIWEKGARLQSSPRR